MPWVRLDDRFPHDPKVRAAGTDAAWLWACGLAYCNAHTTAGRITKDDLPALYPGGFSSRKLLSLARKLSEVGLWTPLFTSPKPSWDVVNYAVYQEEAMPERVREKRANARERKRKQRNAVRSRDEMSHCDTPVTVTRDSPRDLARAPDPTRPGPARPGPTLPSGGSVTDAAGGFRLEPTGPKTAAQRPPASDALSIFWEVWLELWGAEYGSLYVRATSDQGTMKKLSVMASDHAKNHRTVVSPGTVPVVSVGSCPDRVRSVATHWIGSYLADADQWIVDKGHPLKHLGAQLSRYGLPWGPKPRRRSPGPSEVVTRPGHVVLGRGRKGAL